MNDEWLNWCEWESGRNCLFVENPNDPDNTLTVAVSNSGRLIVSVSDERPVDSYNEKLECTIHLPRGVVEKLAKVIQAYLNGDSVS